MVRACCRRPLITMAEEPPQRPPPDMPGLYSAATGTPVCACAAPRAPCSGGANSPLAVPVQTSPASPRSAAAARIGKRYKEMLESECQLCDDMEKLVVTLSATSQVLAGIPRQPDLQQHCISTAVLMQTSVHDVRTARRRTGASRGAPGATPRA